MSRFVSFWRSFALLVARLGLGGILILHGATRYQAGIGSQVAYLAQFSTPYPEVAAYAATTFEIVGGLFLILGALTPLVGLGVLVQQVLTILWTSYYKGPNLLNADGTYHGGLRVLGGAGPARPAVPRLRRRRRQPRPRVPPQEGRARAGRRADRPPTPRRPPSSPGRTGSARASDPVSEGLAKNLLKPFRPGPADPAGC